MADYTLREYRAADVPAISLLWNRVFGDPLTMTAEFFALLPDMGSAVVAEMDGKIVGAASVINGFELVGKRKKAPVVGYLYAVMVAPEQRGLGIGMALSKEAAELAKRRESVLFCTLPADREGTEADGDLIALASGLRDRYEDAMEQFQFQDALEALG